LERIHCSNKRQCERASDDKTSGLSPRRFCSGQLLTRASVENPVLDQATVHLLAGWQITAFSGDHS
jgi:hypothetical protein